MNIAKFFWGKRKSEAHTSLEIPLTFYNTISRKKEIFTPLKPGTVKMYNCGPTVYDHSHIGNLRTYVFADILKRTLVYNGYKVKQVINITDVGHLTSDEDDGEDKMSKALRREGKELTLKNMKQLGERYTKFFIKDLEKLNIKTKDILFPRASDYIEEQIALAKSLEEKGYAYATKDGVYFDTSKFDRYGVLGNTGTEKVKEGARAGTSHEKHNPADFALWKLDENIGWDSPWGIGFPGWHLECTSMVFAKLGRQIDIHTGGMDHIPVHHNNEIAQAESITKKRYVKYWLHNAFITIENRKIAKSLGNTILLRQVEDRGLSAISYRYWLLTGHYRSPMNSTWEALEGAHTALSRLLRIFVNDLGEKNGTVLKTYRKRFHEHINDDLDTPGALAVLWELVRNESVSKEDKRVTLLDFDRVLGLGLIEGHRKLKSMLSGMEKKLSISKVPDDIGELVKKRETANADLLRKEIESKGYGVEDTPNGPEIKHIS